MQAMTVKELIGRLQAEDPDALVLRATDGDVAAKPVSDISKVSVKMHDRSDDAPAVLLT
jgi:hypothetical protein